MSIVRAVYAAQDPTDYNVKSINHRGYSKTAPENTLPAYQLSKEMGYDYVEADISFTKDGVPVLLHDGKINRTARRADGSKLNKGISINSITYEEALDYDFGIWKGKEYKGTKIPTFEEFLALCKDLELHPYIELKENGAYTRDQIEGLVEMVEGKGMQYDETGTDIFISMCQDAGLPLEVWTVDQKGIMKELDPYISGVTTNKLLYSEVMEEED